MALEADLVDYALALSYDDMGPDQRAHIVNLVVDVFGTAIGAAVLGHESGAICESYAIDRRAGGDNREATLWSGNGRLPSDEAALCNGTWAEVLDFQDVIVIPRNNGHAGATIVPATVAIAEFVKADGRSLIAAIAAGLEVTIAVLNAIGRRHRSEGRGFRTTTIASPLGASVACAKLLGLNADHTLNALGIAGACAISGLMPSLAPSEGRFGMDKDLAIGFGAQLAVNAARLAQRGMTASHAVVTGDRGILASHAHGDARVLAIPAGGAPNVLDVALKKYPASYGVHASVEAVLTIMAAETLRSDEIEKIIVRVKDDSVETLSARTPANHMAARFSLPYCVASAAIRGRCALADFETDALEDRSVRDMMTKVELIADPVLTSFYHATGSFPGEVELVTGRGTFRLRIDYPRGSRQRPMDINEVDAKFGALTARRFSGEAQKDFLALARGLAGLADVNELTGRL
jgi:2-methylcitrate dehydratase PrpD